MKKVKSFQIRLEGERVLFRNEFQLLGLSKIQDFVVQLEVVEGNKHLTPVRYDIRHKFFHRDVIDRNGNNVEKVKFYARSNEEAVVLFIEDLIQNWKSILKAGGYNNLLVTLKSLPENKMQKAKEYLVNLIQHPDTIDNVPNVVDLTLPAETLSLSDSVTVKLIKGKTD